MRSPETVAESAWNTWICRLLPWILGLVAWCVYVQGNYVPGGDVTPTELLPISVLTEGDLDLDEFYDKDSRLPFWVVVRKDRVISYYPIVAPLLNLPRVWWARLQGQDLYLERERLAHDTACVITALSVVCMVYVFYGLGLSTRTCAFFGALYAFGTCVWSIGSQALWQHGPSLLFLAGAMALLLRNNRWLPLAGLLLGLAVFNRPTNAVFAVPLTLYVFIHHRPRVLWFLMWAAIPALLMGLYSHVYWGSILSLGQGHSFSGTHGDHKTGFGYPLFKGLASVLISPSRGVFTYTPVLLFALPVWALSFWRSKEQPILRYIAYGAAFNLILLAKWQVWWGGWSWGYRMLVEMVPALMVFLAMGWQRLSSSQRRGAQFAKVVMIALIPFGVYIQYLGAFYFNNDWNRKSNGIDSPQGQERLWDWRDSQWMHYHRMRSEREQRIETLKTE